MKKRLICDEVLESPKFATCSTPEKDILKRLVRGIFIFVALATSSLSYAQQIVSIPYSDYSGATQQVDAVISFPTSQANRKAVILLHTAGGYRTGTTPQYASLLTSNGYIALELRMFEAKPENPQKHLAQVFGALRFLVARGDIDKSGVSLLGQSYGGALSIYAATAWANQKYNPEGAVIRSIAALYPTCFFHHELVTQKERVTNRMASFGFPKDFYKSWVGVPVKILIGGEDDYESRDPNACNSFVEAIGDQTQRERFTVQLFPSATHGWDHGRTYSFRDPLACKWTGCENTNRSDQNITELGKASLLEFFSKP